MNLEHLSEAQSNDTTKIKTQHMTKVANESYELIRAMLAVLQTGDSTDPLSLFTRYIEQVAERSSFQSNITSQGDPKQLSINQIRQLFLIYREALSNIEKYALAGQVGAEFIWNESTLKFIISDDGRGFNLDSMQTSGHYGLKFMHERAELLKGSLSIQSAPGKGTKITVNVPYEYGSSNQSQ
jgi:signal transduction histidine kinase